MQEIEMPDISALMGSNEATCALNHATEVLNAANEQTSPDTYETLKIDQADRTIGQKRRFFIHSDLVIKDKSKFREKLLCDGLTFTSGHMCVFSCKFCYVNSLFSLNKRLNFIRRENKLAPQDFIVDIADAPQVARDFLLSFNQPKYNDPEDRRIIYGSPFVDVAASMDHVRTTTEICLAILESTYWQIRLLSKSSLLLQIAKAIPLKFKDRLIYGFSTGTIDDDLATVFECGTGRVSKRLAALHWLQDHGYRTFAMICPFLPQQDYDKFASEVAAKIRIDRCEHVWAEPINKRGNSLTATHQALVLAGKTKEADLLKLVADNEMQWEIYTQKAFTALQRHIPAKQFRFLQYASENTRDWWQRQTSKGAVILTDLNSTENENYLQTQGILEIELPESLEDFALKIKHQVHNQVHQFVDETIAIGRAFWSAQYKYDASLPELAMKSGLAYNTVTQYVKIAKYYGDPKNSWARAQLPPSVDSMVRLSRLKPEQLENAAKNGELCPDMGRKDVKALLRKSRPPSKSVKPLKKDRIDATSIENSETSVTDVCKQLTSLQNYIEECANQFPGKKADLIPIFETHANWANEYLTGLGCKLHQPNGLNAISPK